MNNLLASGRLDFGDFLARVDLLAAVGLHILVSNYSVFFRLTQYFRRYTAEPIGVVLGINTLLGVLDEKYYENLPGGILEAIGRLFRENVQLLVYPMHRNTLASYCPPPPAAPGTGDIYTAGNLQVSPHLRHLYAHLLENRHVVGVDHHDPTALAIPSRDILRRIQTGDPGWDMLVPTAVAELIRSRRLFGCPG
jgi:hypothetical protein